MNASGTAAASVNESASGIRATVRRGTTSCSA